MDPPYQKKGSDGYSHNQEWGILEPEVQ